MKQGLFDHLKGNAPRLHAMIQRHDIETKSLVRAGVGALKIEESAMKQVQELIDYAADLEFKLAQRGLTFNDLHEINLQRAARWHPGGIQEWNIAEWTNAMCGEAGEAANAAKKMRRIECKMQQADGDTVAPKTLEEAAAKVGKEVGDTVIYGCLTASRVGLTLEQCVRMAFNGVSEREGFPERI